MISIYHVLFAASCLAPAVVPTTGHGSGAREKVPNFVFVVADGLGWSDCGPYGNTHIRTPNLDLVAKQGMRFERALLTCSACSPSRCSILTGRYPHSTGAAERNMSLPSDQVVVAQPLHDAGYFTAAVGAWHLGPSAKSKFDLVKDGGGPGGYRDWLEVLRKRPKDKPFFLWLASSDPHRPFLPHLIPEPHKPADVVVPPYLPDVEEVRNELAMYYDGISRFDGKLGEVLAELAKQKVAGETVLVVLSDTGPAFPRCKTTVLDSGIRIPLLMRWPGHIPAGTSTSSLVSSIDIAPTVLELCGAKPLPSMQGTSLVPLFNMPQSMVRRYCFAEHNWYDYQAAERAVRSSRYLYIRNDLPEVPRTPSADVVRSPTFAAMRQLRDAGKLTPAQMDVFIKPRPAEELYDMQADPHALANLALTPKYAPLLAEMRGVLEVWRKQTDDAKSFLTEDKYDRDTGLGLNVKIERKGKSSSRKSTTATVRGSITDETTGAGQAAKRRGAQQE